jgi:hypothetical protein
MARNEVCLIYDLPNIPKMGDGMTKRHTTLGVIIAIVTIVGIIGPNSIQQALGKGT